VVCDDAVVLGETILIHRIRDDDMAPFDMNVGGPTSHARYNPTIQRQCSGVRIRIDFPSIFTG
jgi:hypothetical protein